MSLDLPALQDEITDILKDAATRVTGYAKEEFDAVGKELAEKVVRFAASGDKAGMDITLARLRLLEERIRLHVNNEFWVTIEAVLTTSFRVLLKVAAA